MTSTNDGKDVKINQPNAPKGKSYYIELYKGLEARLSQFTEGVERTRYLCEAWRRVHCLCEHSAASTQEHLLSWLQRHTSRTVLQTKWQSPERKDERASLEQAINSFIAESAAAREGRHGTSPPWESQLVARGEWFKRVLERPWDHPVLIELLNPNGTPPTNDEVLKWLKEERGVTFVMRLHALVGDKCVDFALALATAVMQRARDADPPPPDEEALGDPKPKAGKSDVPPSFGDRLSDEAGFTIDVWEALTDIEFVLLHKQDSTRCIALAKQTPLRGAYQLIERLQSRLETSPREKRLWKNAKEVAVLIAQVVVARCMVVRECQGAVRSALYCAARSLARLAGGARLPAAAAALAAPAASARHLHTLAAAVRAQLAQVAQPSDNETKTPNDEMTPFICELYVRALTAGMNELERLKLKTEKEGEARAMEQTLGVWFVQLGGVLSRSGRFLAECALTAFSVHPSAAMYDRVQAAPPLQPPPPPLPPADNTDVKKEATTSEFGSWANDSRSQTNFVKTSETLNMKQSQNQANVLSTALLSEGEAIGLSPDLCQDIAVLLSGPRVKTLSWDMDRNVLLENCRIYMERTHGGTRALTTELKYLNLDPSQFQHLPEEHDEDENDAFYGIEKGYEHLVSLHEPVEIWEDADDIEKTETASDSLDEDFLVSRRKKKNKQIPLSSDDDSNPLSLVAKHTNRTQKKKERPHSKERCKERAKKKPESGDPLAFNDDMNIEIQDVSHQTKTPKEKKERKKNDKVQKSSLSNLVGLKIGKKKEKPAVISSVVYTDSDYSHGKSSLNSFYSEGNDNYDISESINSIKNLDSPMIKLSNRPLSKGTAKNDETKLAFNKILQKNTIQKLQPSNNAPSSNSRNLSLEPTWTHHPPTFRAVPDDVRASITKLLEFRRQKGMMYNRKINNKPTTPAPQPKPPNAIMNHDISIQANISPKAVAIPDIPKSYINKQHAEKLAELKKEVELLQLQNAKAAHFIQYGSKCSVSTPAGCLPNYKIPLNTQQQSKVVINFPQERGVAEQITKQSNFPHNAKSSSYLSQNPDTTLPKPIISEVPGHQEHFRKFLKGYQHSFSDPNNYAVDMSCKPKDSITKENNAINKGKTVMPYNNPETKTNQCAKQLPQKKLENKLNTFSRLSYMHKNKHTLTMPEHNILKSQVTNDFDKLLKEYKHVKDCIQAKKESFNRFVNTSNEKAQSVIKKYEESLANSKNILSNVSQQPPITSNTSLCRNEDVMKNAHIKQKEVTSFPNSTLSEKDQNDLALLLRQKNKLNSSFDYAAEPYAKPALSSNVTVSNSVSDVYNATSTFKQQSYNKMEDQIKYNRRISESKAITIVSNTVIKAADTTNITENPALVGQSKAIIKNSKKNKKPASTASHESKNKSDSSKMNCKKPTVKCSNMPQRKEGWESVLNALLKQKTPSRGPNALDITLNKSSYEESIRSPIIFRDSSKKDHILHLSDNISKNRLSGKVTPEQLTNFNLAKNKDITISLVPTEATKSSNPSQVSNNTKLIDSNVKNEINISHSSRKPPQDVHRKQFTYAGPKLDDPFISGIPNCDFDLLEELMDDDLRKEIGEISSDDESYSITAQAYLKPTKANEKRVSVVYNKPLDDTLLSKKAVDNKCRNSDIILQTVQQQKSSINSKKDGKMSLSVCTEPFKETMDVKLPNDLCLQNSTIVQNKIVNVTKVPTSEANITSTTSSYNDVLSVTHKELPMETNILLTAATQEPPKQNVMLVGPNLVYSDYPTLPTPINSVTETNTYVSVDNEANLNFYQTTQFAPAIVNPLIIQSTVYTVPVASNTSSVSIPPCSDTIDNIVQKPYGAEPQNKKYSQDKFECTLDVVHTKIGTEPKPLTHLLDQNNLLALLETKSSDISKASERKVLCEVQDKITATDKVEKDRFQGIEHEKNKKDIITNNRNEQVDQERLKRKRLAITNREIYHQCDNKPIPLTYSPLRCGINENPHADYSIHGKAINSQCYESYEVSDSLQVYNKSTTQQDILKTFENTPKTTENNESCKENKNKYITCRRILLRSSNKLKKTSTETNTSQISTAKGSQTKLKHEACNLVDTGIEVITAQKRASKRIRNKTLTITKSIENICLKTEIQKESLQVSEHNTNNVESKITSPSVIADVTRFPFFDIEAELLGSKIHKPVSEIAVPMNIKNNTAIVQDDHSNLSAVAKNTHMSNTLSNRLSTGNDLEDNSHKKTLNFDPGSKKDIACKDNCCEAIVFKERTSHKEYDTSDVAKNPISSDSCSSFTKYNADIHKHHDSKNPITVQSSDTINVKSECRSSIIIDMEPKEYNNSSKNSIFENKETLLANSCECLQIEEGNFEVNVKLVDRASDPNCDTKTSKEMLDTKINQTTVDKDNSTQCIPDTNSVLETDEKTYIVGNDYYKYCTPNINLDTQASQHIYKTETNKNSITALNNRQNVLIIPSDNDNKTFQKMIPEVQTKICEDDCKRDTGDVTNDGLESAMAINISEKANVNDLVSDNTAETWKNQKIINTPGNIQPYSDITTNGIDLACQETMETQGNTKIIDSPGNIEPYSDITTNSIDLACQEIMETQENSKIIDSPGNIPPYSYLSTFSKALDSEVKPVVIDAGEKIRTDSEILQKTIENESKPNNIDLVQDAQSNLSMRNKSEISQEVYESGDKPKSIDRTDSTKITSLTSEASPQMVGHENMVVDDDDDIEIVENSSASATCKNIDKIHNSIDESPITSSLAANDDNDVLQSFKDSIIIEPLQNPNNCDPLIKCVRIKLPNGRTFKATVYGDIHVKYDTLFADPAMRAVLLNGLKTRKSYTLNVKQVSTVARGDRTKILSTQIQAIQPKVKGKVVETIDLLSDEEDDAPQVINTEFGRYKIARIDTIIFNKHQEKLRKKSHVSLKKIDVPIKEKDYLSVRPDKESAEDLVSEIKNCGNYELISDSREAPLKDTEIVEIDESSNDSLNILTNYSVLNPYEEIDHLKSNLLIDLGVTTDTNVTDSNSKQEFLISELKSNLLEELGVVNDDKFTADDHAMLLSEDISQPEKLKTTKKLSNTKEISTSKKKFQIGNTCNLDEYKQNTNINRKCYVKLIRCDDLVKTRFESNFNMIQESAADVLSPASSRSVSLLEDLSIPNDLDENLTEAICDRNSPVLEVFDIIASLDQKVQGENFINIQITSSFLCEAEWCFDKRETNINSKRPMTLYRYSDNAKQETNAVKGPKLPATLHVPNLTSIIVKLFVETNYLYQYRSLSEKDTDKKINKPQKRKMDFVQPRHTAKIAKSENKLPTSDKTSTYYKNTRTEFFTAMEDKNVKLQHCELESSNLEHIKESVAPPSAFNYTSNTSLGSFINNTDVMCEAKDTLNIFHIQDSKTANNGLSSKNIQYKKNRHLKKSTTASSDIISDGFTNIKFETKGCEENYKTPNSKTKTSDIDNKGYGESHEMDSVIIAPKLNKNELKHSDKDFNPAAKLTTNHVNNSSMIDIKTENFLRIATVPLLSSIATSVISSYNFDIGVKIRNPLKTEIDDLQQRIVPNVPASFMPDCAKNVNQRFTNLPSIGDVTDVYKIDNDVIYSPNIKVDGFIIPTSNQVTIAPKDGDLKYFEEDNILPVETCCNILSPETEDKMVKLSHQFLKCHKEDVKSDDAVVMSEENSIIRNPIHSYIYDAVNDLHACVEPNVPAEERTVHCDKIIVVSDNEHEDSHEFSSQSPENEKTALRAYFLSDDVLVNYNNMRIENVDSQVPLYTQIELNSDTRMFEMNSAIAENLSGINASASQNCHHELSQTGSKITWEDNVDGSNSSDQAKWDVSVKNGDNEEETSFISSDADAETIISKYLRMIGKDNSQVVLNGVQYEDPESGTCYVIPIIEKTPETVAISEENISNEVISYIKHITDCDEEKSTRLQANEDDDIFKLILPKHTYSKSPFYDVEPKKTLKRRLGMRDIKCSEKKYRKGKNIDYTKRTAADICDTAYKKEYKYLTDYCRSIKFSYAIPFHKDYIDVHDMLQSWPINDNHMMALESPSKPDETLFVDIEETKRLITDPTTQTLSEEIVTEYDKITYQSSNFAETNFSMGFGEESDRVIHDSKDGENITFSAATLSDVKQLQPLDPSKEKEMILTDFKSCESRNSSMMRFIDNLKLKDKVRSFFKKTSLELAHQCVQENKKCYDDTFIDSELPFGLSSLDFILPAPDEMIVNVVQVGQLPVSATAQNPVTCDPRVTHVSNVSPSQCPENSADDLHTTIKTEYTELTTAEITLPYMQEYAHNHRTITTESQEGLHFPIASENIPISTEIKSIVKIELMEETSQENMDDNNCYNDSHLQHLTNNNVNHDSQYHFDNMSNSTPTEPNTNATHDLNSTNQIPSIEPKTSQLFPVENPTSQDIDKTDQITHAMSAAGINIETECVNQSADALVDMISQNAQSDVVSTTLTASDHYSKPTSITAMALQQALAQILPPPLNQTNGIESNQTPTNPQVLHIVQSSNAQSVINKSNGTPMLHIVQNKNTTANGTPTSQCNGFSGLSIVDAGLQQNGNQFLHIVNTGNQKHNAGQILKRVNLLTNLANVQGSNEQKLVQFVCKSADGKSIQLSAPHQRGMVLRLQTVDAAPNVSSNVATPKTNENHDLTSPSDVSNGVNGEEPSAPQEVKSTSVYEENLNKLLQSSSPKQSPEKATSLPKFNQVFGKQIYQDQQSSMDTDNMPENSETVGENNVHIRQMSPPLLLRTPPTTQPQPHLVQQLKQTIAPVNLQTMHGGVIYTRQIPVNLGGGQTINLITVPSTELVDDSGQKAPTEGKFNNHEGESPIIKIVPANPSNTNLPEESQQNNSQIGSATETNSNPPPQPVLTQMRIKLPMISKAPQMVGGARVVRPSFFQIQRNVIGAANQQVYQQLVLTAAPSLGQTTIRVPAQAQTNRQSKSPETQSSSESQMSSSTLEQLREFDMVLEQVKERSTVQPNTSNTNTFTKSNGSADITDSPAPSTSTLEPTTQVLYSIGNGQPVSIVNFVNRKSTITSTTTTSFVRSPDSTGVIESPTSTQVPISHTTTSPSTSNTSEAAASAAPKPKKKKSRPSQSSSALKLHSAPAKTSSQKPLEDEQTTQRILYILAEYKEQVENSPDKDKPAPRRRNNPGAIPGVAGAIGATDAPGTPVAPATPGATSVTTSKRKKNSRRRDSSPVLREESSRTMGSEDSSCGTSQGECNECSETPSSEESPRKVVRRLTFEQETHITQSQAPNITVPQRNVIVADGQAIAVTRGPTVAGKPTAATVLMPANYLLPVSMVKGGQQIAIVTNRGPKLLVGSGDGATAGALLFQRLIGPGGLKPMLTRPGVRHIRLPAAALHNLQAFNITTPATLPPDSTASPATAPNPPDLIDTRAMSSPWPDRESQDAKPDRDSSSPEGSEPWNIPSSSIADDYGYEEIVRTDNMDRAVLDAIPDRYSPDMEAQRIFDKMFDVDSKKSMYDSRCSYDIDASDDDKPYHQVVQRKDGKPHRLTHVSAAALRHKYAILEHELRLQKSLSEECEDLGVDSPSASDLFPEAELFFAPSPAHEQTIEQCPTPQPSLSHGIPQPDLDDQIASDHLLHHEEQRHDELDINLDDVGEIVTVGEDGIATIPLDHEEFARSHPNTTFHSEPEEGEFTIAQGPKGRQIFQTARVPGTVVMGPQTTVISQATVEATGSQGNIHKFNDINTIMNVIPTAQNIPPVLVKDDGFNKFDLLTRDMHMPNTAPAIVHPSGHGAQVIRRVYDNRRDARYLVENPDVMIAGDGPRTRHDGGIESPERPTDLFWDPSVECDRRRLDFDNDKCCKSPFEETTDSNGIGAHTRLDSVIKAARPERRSPDHPPLRTYPPKRSHHQTHHHHSDSEKNAGGKTNRPERCHESEGKRRASNRGVVKRGCHCCSGSPAPTKPKKSRTKKPAEPQCPPN